MKLYGSTTSPYVRRLRILLADVPHEFINVNIFGAEDRSEIKKVNPVMKVPMLEDMSNSECPFIYDSGNIAQYILQKTGQESLTLAQLNDLSVINAANDSLVNLMLLTRSGFDTSEDKLYFNLQKERLDLSFKLLEQQVAEGRYNQWNYVAISLLVMIEWAQFRELYDFSQFPHLMRFIKTNQSQTAVTETSPT
ncbi:MAG: glutathione S-transferase family protein [Gammaproteobacteria bacterium]|nr:glutathione S-transferase family protein [Gammaproteobacteria bacterium]